MSDKCRITITISKEQVSRLDAFCKSTGISRGSCISMLLATHIPDIGNREPVSPSRPVSATEYELDKGHSGDINSLLYSDLDDYLDADPDSIAVEQELSR